MYFATHTKKRKTKKDVTEFICVFSYLSRHGGKKCTWMHLIKTGIGYQAFPEPWWIASQNHPTPPALNLCSPCGFLFFSFMSFIFLNKNCMYLRCNTWWFDILSERITTVKLINISSPHTVTIFFMCWEYVKSILPNFQYSIQYY